MNHLSVQEMAKKWGVSARSVRNYCAEGRVHGAVLVGKTWKIPADTEKPRRLKKGASKYSPLLKRLQQEQADRQAGGIYHKIQIELTYNSNHMAGSRLTHEQICSIYETNSLGITGECVNVDDVVETVNHFRCIDLVIQQAHAPLTAELILELHRILKTSTSADRFAMEDRETTISQEAAGAMEQLLEEYRKTPDKQLEDLLDFHVRFVLIHPFQDGNGRVGRLLLLKECLHYGIVPFVFQDDQKMDYYRGLCQWGQDKRELLDACLEAQERFRADLRHFQIPVC